MARRTQKNAVLKIAGVGAFAALLLGAGLQLASADDNSATAVSVTCPTVADKLGAVPAAAQAGVDQELRNLENQIANVNARLAREPGAAQQQLGDIAGKRNAVLERITLNITRVGGTAPAGLQGLAACALSNGAASGNPNAGSNNAGNGNNNAGNNNAAAPAGAQTVNCPDVSGRIGAVPAAAQANIDRELAALQQQINEANARLAQLAVRPEGGPNFVQLAILGPLEDKRIAVLDRIRQSFTRLGAAAPAGLDALATCGVNAPANAGNAGNAGNNAGNGNAGNNNAGNAGNNAGNGNAGNGNAGNGNGNAGNGNAAPAGAQTVNCPDVTGRIGAVPAAAQAGVNQELANLQQQINEANTRLAQLAVRPEGGPNFVQLAILGPLEDKRIAVINRIATNIGRVTGERPVPPLELATCGLN
ncbi:hypothetical protein [Micromonospora yangpuensis]|uniref:Uncharacterized protein n=1 Tax=Micromonospora yangpuensis TaxID=683228 RepID=A0A1C6UUR6_9ACTN|nr:hypothetical protein [Micromonospora yangpuensis]GGM24020.1 hypothetical protein GCM10012279_47980 [Micromonospora yangpuensis]SCL57706.1 hypothetical protein GA0070617_3602 [Micromonospora yangpuensis]